MNFNLLNKLEGPDDLKGMSREELELLAAQIRGRMVGVTAKTGGHLASSLGAVEIILALHRVFDFSTDRLVFDVGHQAYAHKIVTGRNANFDTLRQKGGVSGFPKRHESRFDVHDAGHASDSLSIASGIATARDLRGSSEEVVVLIGDASLSGGMAFEALNQIGNDQKNIIIVLNDNEMSISKNVGALSLYLGKARMSRPYTWTRDTVEGNLEKTGRLGHALVSAGEAAKASFKKLVVPGMFFEDMGIKYFGPIDGHNIGTLEEAFGVACSSEGPVLIHAVTRKGQGFAPAEAMPEFYHGVGPFDPATGIAINGAASIPTYTEIFGASIVEEATLNEDIVAITAGMMSGTGLTEFSERYPDRFIDVGIAEEHAVGMAAGLALSGKRPVVTIYSTFLQRTYDQIIMDVAQQDLPVVFCVDRAGLVGEDGATHQGAFDLVYLRSVPYMHIIAPYTATDLYLALRTALKRVDGPTAIRYPRCKIPTPAALEEYTAALALDDEGLAAAAAADTLPLGKAKRLLGGNDLSILALGDMVGTALKCAGILLEQGIKASVFDILWVKPIDTEAIRLAADTGHVVTLENGSLKGGFGSAVLEELVQLELSPVIQTFGLPDSFIEHGSQASLFAELGLTAEDIARQILQKHSKSQPQSS